MAFYSRLKFKIKKISNTYFGRLLLFPILFIYFQTKTLRIRFSNLFYSYFYYYSSKLSRNNDLTIGVKVLGKNNTKFPHPIGIVIGKYVKIGYGCTIYQNVTIGAKTDQEANIKNYPTIGNNVVIGTNSVIIGKINIGNNVFIGASTFVNKDIPDNVVVYGNPIKFKINGDK